MVISVRSGATKHSTGSPGNQSTHNKFLQQALQQQTFDEESKLCRFLNSPSISGFARKKINVDGGDYKKNLINTFHPIVSLTLSPPPSPQRSLSRCVTQQLLHGKLLWNGKKKFEGKTTNTHSEKGKIFKHISCCSIENSSLRSCVRLLYPPQSSTSSPSEQ